MVPRPFIRSHNSQVEDFYVFGDGQEGNVTGKKFLAIAMLFAVLSFQSKAQSHTDMAALKGLSPVTMLSNTPTGNAVLGANYVATGGIQTGAIEQPTLLPFSEQQQQALRDAFVTDGNLAQLADGLGTTLGAGYMARAHYIDRQNFTGVSQTVSSLISYANATSGGHSNAGKYSGWSDARALRCSPSSGERSCLCRTLVYRSSCH